MLSQLAQGVGSWTGEIYPAGNVEKAQASLPYLDEETHRHGVTVSARGRAGDPCRTQTPDPSKARVPKTFLTRKGALLIFTAPEGFDKSCGQAPVAARLLRRKQQHGDPSSNFGTIDRFAKSVLMFGDEDYERENTSISDKENAIFLKFLHSLDSEKLQDLKLQPGGDFSKYLLDVKSRATSARLSSHGSSGKRKLTADADSLLDAFTRPASQASHQHSSRPSSAKSQKSYRVLSADKLRASLHSASSYLGRPRSALITTKEEEEEADTARHGSGRSRGSQTRGSLSSYDARSAASAAVYRSNKKYYTLLDNVHGAQGDAIVTPPPSEGGDLTASEHGEGDISRGRVSKSLPVHGSIHSVHETAPNRRPSQTSQQSAHSGSMLHGETSHGNMVAGNNMLHSGNMSTNDNMMSGDNVHDNMVAAMEGTSPAMTDMYPIPLQADRLGELASVRQMAFFDDARSVSSSILQEEDIIMVADDIVLEDMHETLEAGDEAKEAQDGEDGQEEDDEARRRKLQNLTGQDGVYAPPSSPSDVPDQLSSRTRSANSGAFDADVEDECDSNFAGPLQPQYKMANLLGSMEGTFVLGDPPSGPGGDARVDSQTAAQVIAHRDSVHSHTSGRASRTSRRRSRHSASQDHGHEKGSRDTKSEHMAGPRKTSSRRSSRHTDRVLSARSSISSISRHEPEPADDKHDPDSAREDTRSRMSTHSVHSKRSRSGSRRSSKASLRSRSRTPTDREEVEGMESRPETPPTEVQAHHQADIRTEKEEESAAQVLMFKPETVATEDTAGTTIIEASDVDKPTSAKSRTTEDILAAGKTIGEDSKAPDRETLSSKGRSSVLSQHSTESHQAVDNNSMTSHLPDQLQPTENLHDEEEDSVKVSPPEPAEPVVPIPPSKTDKQTKASDKAKKNYVKAMDIATMNTPPAKAGQTSAPVVKPKAQSSPKKEKPSTKHKTSKSPVSKPANTGTTSPNHLLSNDLQKELEQLLADSPKPVGESPKPQPDGELRAKAKAKADEKRRKEEEARRKKEEEALKKIEKEVTDILEPSESSRQAEEEGGGLTVEEMELEAKILKEKMEQAEQKIKGAEPKKKVKKEKEKKSKKNKEPKKDLAQEREALREARRLEKEKRLEEARALEEKIKQKDEEKRLAEQEALRKQRDLEEEMAAIREEEEQARLAEEDAQAALVSNRKAVREERENRRKAEAERKKAEVQRRRDEERKMQERARAKEREMLSRIADSEQRRILEEQDRIRREEEELLELEREEEEERRAKLEAEEREEMEREIERQIEEEAMARIVREREEAEEKRRKVEAERRKLQEEEDRKKEKMLAERRKLEVLQEKQAEEERRRQEEERQRLAQLQQMEEEARQSMRHELEKRREAALRRRDINLERKSNLDGIKRGQGITKPWVFSYYIKWPRETYQKPMGEDPKDKKRGFRPKPKPKPSPTEGATVQVAAT